MVKILVIDDDYVWQAKIESMLAAYNSHYSLVGSASDLESAVQMISYTSPDIIITDVFLGRENIFDAILPILNKYPTVIITSSHEEENFQKSQKLNNCIFLVKPFFDFTLLSSLNLLEKKCSILINKSKFLTFNIGKGKRVKTSFTNIVKFTVEGNYCVCYTGDGKKYAKKISLNLLLETLDDSFIRVNKTTAVNLDFITKIDFSDKFVYLGKELHVVGRSYINALKDINIIIK